MLILALFACSPQPPSDWNAEGSRTAPHLEEPMVAFTKPPGVWPWTPERAVGECIEYDRDGAEASRIEVTADGLPLTVQWSGARWEWRRQRNAKGIVSAARIYSYGPQSERPYLVLQELYDDGGRLRWQGWPGDEPWEDGKVWSYDHEGRLIAVADHGADPWREEYEYTDSGRLASRSYTPTYPPPSSWKYDWDAAGRLEREVRGGDDWVSAIHYTKYHPTGLPELGEVSASDYAGGPYESVVEWSYDAEGRPLRRTDRGEGASHREEWAWDGGDLVLYEEYWTDRDGVEQLRNREEWTWEKGRVTSHTRPMGRGDSTDTWAWDEDGDLAGITQRDDSWSYEGDCPPSLFRRLLPEDPTPSPLPRIPEPPLPYGL